MLGTHRFGTEACLLYYIK